MDEELPIPGDPRVIDRAAVMPMLGPTERAGLSFREQYRPAIEAVRKYPDRLVGTFMLNPHQGVDSDHPSTMVILAHLGTQKIGYADDAINVARHCDNVYPETG